MNTALPEPVLIIGTGLVGTSIGLALRRVGVEVCLSDANPEAVRTASGLGAGVKLVDQRPGLVVVAVPPDALPDTVLNAARDYPDAVLTDVGSVKLPPLSALENSVAATRYVGSHPMAGSERSGPLAAAANLFEGRPWALAKHAQAAPSAIATVHALARTCGANVVEMDALSHDQAVARTSHVPYLTSVLTAGQLTGASKEQLALSGQGLRDVTRVAGSDPELWGQIISGNAEAISPLLRELQANLSKLIDALAAGDRAQLVGVLSEGLAGTGQIPGKHGGPPIPISLVYVTVLDHPGELARLFTSVGEIEVNIEDLRIDHDPGREFGLVELSVAEDQAELLMKALESRGWAVHR